MADQSGVRDLVEVANDGRSRRRWDADARVVHSAIASATTITVVAVVLAPEICTM